MKLTNAMIWTAAAAVVLLGSACADQHKPQTNAQFFKNDVLPLDVVLAALGPHENGLEILLTDAASGSRLVLDRLWFKGEVRSPKCWWWMKSFATRFSRNYRHAHFRKSLLARACTRSGNSASTA